MLGRRHGGEKPAFRALTRTAAIYGLALTTRQSCGPLVIDVWQKVRGHYSAVLSTIQSVRMTLNRRQKAAQTRCSESVVSGGFMPGGHHHQLKYRGDATTPSIERLGSI